jgi:hypothetical protein
VRACLSDQGKISLLQELIKQGKGEIRNGFILGLFGLLFASFGFFSYGVGLWSLSLAWLALGTAGSAMVIAAFYVMIHVDRRMEDWKKQLRETTIPTKSLEAEPEHSAADDDQYFDLDYEKSKNPFEEDKE